MELQEFLAVSLKQIVKGVQDAQEFLPMEAPRAQINPRAVTALKKENQGPRQRHDINTKLPVDRVAFDVAVTPSNPVKESAGGALRVWALDFWRLGWIVH